jgi:NLI interacting factor-like phosphatase
MIFVDLDNTLIHATWGGNPNKKRVKIDLGINYLGGKEIYWSMMRPNSISFLEECRKLAKTYLLTFSDKDYAIAHNEAFKLGFEEKEIFGRDDFSASSCGMFVDRVYAKKTNTCPNAILVDDNEPSHEHAKIKMAFLGIGEERYIKSRRFIGREPKEFEKELKALHSLIKDISPNSNSNPKIISDPIL